MFLKSKLQKVLEKWVVNKGDLSEALDAIGDIEINKKKDAISIVEALKSISYDVKVKEHQFSSPVHCLTAFFQDARSKEAYEVFKENGIPELRRLLKEGLKFPKNREDDLMFIMKILGIYQQKQDASLIAEVALSGFQSDSYMWTVIFGIFDEEHEYWKVLLEALRNPLPKDFIRVSYLDFANKLLMGKKKIRHPFDSDQGVEILKSYLSDTDRDSYSYAHSATVALPFLHEKSRTELSKLAQKHPDISVRIESDWVLAKLGDKAGVNSLKNWALDPNYSSVACAYLKELGYEKEIPSLALEENFVAMAEMCDWLSHPNEFGRPPDKIEQYDSRTLYWPPTDDERKVWLFKYNFKPLEKGDKLETGISMVGSITFALFGEATQDLSPVEVYGLHCAWELESNEDSRAPKKRSPASGLKILKQYNKDL